MPRRVAWPAGWVALAMQLPRPAGIVDQMIIAIAVLSAVGRMHRAAWQNHRYHFTTWHWERVGGGLLLIGFLLKAAMQM